MADLTLDIDANIKQLSADVKALNTNLEKTEKNTGKIATSSKNFGDYMANAAKTFIVGSAFRLGVRAIKDDMVETHASAIGIVKSLKEIEFLKGKEGKIAVRGIAKRTGLSIAEVSSVAAPVFSANPNMTMQQLTGVIENALIEQKSSSAPALAVAKGTSGLLNSSTTFQDNGAGEIGAQNFLVKTAKQSNMAVSQIGRLAPLFATASAVGVSPFEAAAGLEILTSSDLSVEESVTMMKSLMIQWSIYGKDEGMSLMEFITYAVGIKDAKKRRTILPQLSGVAAATLSQKGAAAFKSSSDTFSAAGASTVSSSVQEYNRKIENDPAFRGEQLSESLKNLKNNRDMPGDEVEQGAVIGGVGTQIWQTILGGLKTAIEAAPIPAAIQYLTDTPDPLGANRNFKNVGDIQDVIDARALKVSLDNTAKVNSKLDSTLNTAETTNLP